MHCIRPVISLLSHTVLPQRMMGNVVLAYDAFIQVHFYNVLGVLLSHNNFVPNILQK